jgi:hypothetical protein
MNVRTYYFVRVWKHDVNDERPLYAGWIYAYSASEAMRMAAGSWSDQPVDFALITVDNQWDPLPTVETPKTMQ